MPPTESSAGRVVEELEKILASSGFARNDRLGKFLRFIVEQHIQGTAGQLKETLIGIELFGRKHYDPKEDSLVRTEAARLRARISQYYAEEGSRDAVIIELPKGGYAPVIRVLGEPAPARAWAGRKAAIAAAVLAILVSGGWWLAARKSEPSVIAVLPFKSLSTEPANEYFTDGLTDEVIRNLSIIDGLQVRSRTSSFAFKDKPRNLPELGAQLHANYVVEGSVLRSDGRLRINAQLVRVADDFPLWSGHWDRELRDIFAIQDEISRSIVNQLRLKLRRGQRRYDTDQETYALYLRGRAVQAGFTIPKYREAIGIFEQVIARDPAFAPAYAGLAAAYTRASTNNFGFPPDETYPKIRAAAQKALELDPLLAEAEVAMGLVYSRQPAWIEAEKALGRAIELNPNLSEAYLYLGFAVHQPLGHLDQAVHDLRKAQEIDPMSREVRYLLASVLLNLGRHKEAADICRRILVNYPEDPLPTQILGRALLQKGNRSEAIAIFEKQGVISNGFRGYSYALDGRRTEAEQLAAAAEQRDFPNHLALIYAGLGDKDRTVEALGRMAAKKDPRIYAYLYYPELALIRGDPGLKEFRMRIGLPQ